MQKVGGAGVGEGVGEGVGFGVGFGVGAFGSSSPPPSSSPPSPPPPSGGAGRVPVLPLELTYVDPSQLEESQLTISP